MHLSRFASMFEFHVLFCTVGELNALFRGLKNSHSKIANFAILIVLLLKFIICDTIIKYSTIRRNADSNNKCNTLKMTRKGKQVILFFPKNVNNKGVLQMKYNQLSREQRYTIYCLLQKKTPKSKIVRARAVPFYYLVYFI